MTLRLHSTMICFSFFFFFFLVFCVTNACFVCLLFNLMPSRRSAPLIDHCSLFPFLPPFLLYFSLVLFSSFLFFLMFILSCPDLILSLFSSIKTLILRSFYLCHTPVSTVFSLLPHFISSSNVPLVFAPRIKLTFSTCLWCVCFCSLFPSLQRSVDLDRLRV